MRPTRLPKLAKFNRLSTLSIRLEANFLSAFNFWPHGRSLTRLGLDGEIVANIVESQAQSTLHMENLEELRLCDSRLTGLGVEIIGQEASVVDFTVNVSSSHKPRYNLTVDHIINFQAILHHRLQRKHQIETHINACFLRVNRRLPSQAISSLPVSPTPTTQCVFLLRTDKQEVGHHLSSLSLSQ